MEWLNNNQGLLTLILFITTLILGWISGIFSSLRNRPKFIIELLKGPTFSCTFDVGKKENEYDIHRTGIALYLSVKNTGSAPSSIASVSVSYHWNIAPFSVLWLKYSVGWFHLENQTIALEDFQAEIGNSLKIYPFLFQQPVLGRYNIDTYLKVGQQTKGVVYFEQPNSWGGCFPKIKNSKIKIKVTLQDTFGNKHRKNFYIPSVTLEEARKYNPSFGKSMSEINNENLPYDS